MKLKTKQFALAFLFIANFGSVYAQSTSNVRVGFSCATGQTTVTYDLTASCPTDVILYYSPDTINWLRALTVSGDLTAQSAGTGKTIIWNNITDYVQYGGFYFKVDAAPCTNECVMINGVCWATRNLAAHGVFVDNPQDYGALFQWGRKGDGHEQRTSQNYPTNNTVLENGVVSGAVNFDANGQIVSTHAAYGKFIKQNASPYDWRSPQDNALWNVGTEAAPVKTANDPCPAGYRVPTQSEFVSLAAASNVWATEGGVSGRKFTDGGNSLFLPAAGCRRSNNGSLTNAGTNGFYWSSTVSGSDLYDLAFNDGNVGTSYSYRAYGQSVRCVAE